MKRKKENGQFDYGVYEVFYDDDGQVKGHTQESLTPTCDSKQDLKFELEVMIQAFDKGTLTYEDKD